MTPKIVFFGSSKYSTIVEEAVYKKFSLSAVYTLPDRQSDSQILISPVKKFAQLNNIPFFTTEKLTREVITQIKTFSPDFLIVADYGLLLPPELLQLPKSAPLNVHHSLLPKYRGPSPAPASILAGEKTTGVTIMIMEEGLDTGDILAQKEYTMQSTDTTDSLLTTLNTLGAEILVEVLQDFDTYFKNRKKQDDSKASFSKHMTKQDGHIDINNPPSAQELDRMIRAYFPWPGVWFTTKLNGEEVRIKLLPEQKVQVEGKKAVLYKDFINGYPKIGEEILSRLHLL